MAELTRLKGLPELFLAVFGSATVKRVLRVKTNDHTQDVRLVTQQVLQNFTTWPYLPCLWR